MKLGLHDLAEVAREVADALAEARPYVFGQVHRDDWRGETARKVLERVDAALALEPPCTESDTA